MKVVAFNGSPRKKGNTYLLLRAVMEEIEKEGIETELIQLGGETISGCQACYVCQKNMDGKCKIEDDMVNDCIEKMVEADGILIGSPTYFSDMSTETKALIDRAGLVALFNGGQLKRKVGAAVVAVRRAGAIHAFDSINHFFTINQMIVPGSSYWNVGFGAGAGEVQDDEEGMETMRTLGKNMAWLLKRISD